jgi:hypothetical protein
LTSPPPPRVHRNVPLNGYHATAEVWPAGRPIPASGDRPQAQYRMISLYAGHDLNHLAQIERLIAERTG